MLPYCRHICFSAADYAYALLPRRCRAAMPPLITYTPRHGAMLYAIDMPPAAVSPRALLYAAICLRWLMLPPFRAILR